MIYELSKVNTKNYLTISFPLRIYIPLFKYIQFCIYISIFTLYIYLYIDYSNKLVSTYGLVVNVHAEVYIYLHPLLVKRIVQKSLYFIKVLCITTIRILIIPHLVFIFHFLYISLSMYVSHSLYMSYNIYSTFHSIYIVESGISI